ncbi:hypothetical protein [Bifidobacterium sp.]|jgi:hypothetical protein|uniref:hypothetical protein n=1 Tax=Bifidobacterium sp. TaxID=41200 RepID=UPI0025C67E67|nr:hypothetical protein [Bifidobacterium sp.]MCH4209287.1 hypothetical protein [Bifidobacterium sp.]MCI1224081.1 hypothetical protein [Bifidobacterium sp.]
MADDATPDDGGSPQGDFDDVHFSDEELQAALEGFEKEFDGQEPGQPELPNDSDTTGKGAGQGADDGVDGGAGTSAGDDFDEELKGLVGDKAKTAALITRLASARLLAAFCQLADIAADCIGSEQGAVAVLRNLDGDAPESAAKDLTTVVSGMAAVLAVNRADKLESTLYLHGEAGQTFAPPILFASTPGFVEDLMLGIANLEDLRAQGLHSIDSGALSRDQAMKVIADHTRFGRGSSSIQ